MAPAVLGSLSLPIYLFHPIVIDAIILFRPTMLTFEVLLGQVLLWTLIVSIVYDGVQRIIQRKKQYHHLLLHPAEVYLIMLGTNDSKLVNWNAKQYEKELEQLIMTLQASSPKAKIYLLTPLWSQAKEDKKGPKHTIRDFVVQQEIYPIIQHVSQKRCVEMIDLYHPFLQQGKLFSDGVHPNKEGNLKLAQLIFEKVKEKEIGQ